ncbi:camphor resistance protein CrcB [Allofrancisella inopinata]|uniref:Fluoride-specific ion channel FluC n=1 Tax=Allofrancisella inopinata TaxID=1085647 RepID=A0AAE6YID0_9GAMM|nr:fluoride efflux transporter CrcB [Allofrancisella inopinata]QIV95319.1 fluoride efflux transporter CrcB [Allofrancisella inopinata]TDT69083.1 camphor resistance protein CrcB [Allofrancisella inopinata]
MRLMILLVGIGGGLGAIARFSVMQVSASMSKQIPVGIFLCNVIGSFLIGLIAAFLIKTNLFNESFSAYTRALLVTGFLGGFTTFSSFSLDILNLLQRGEAFLAFGYILASVFFSLLAVVVAFYLVVGIYK